MAPSFATATAGVPRAGQRRRVGDGQHVAAGRRLDRHRAAQHARRVGGDRLRRRQRPGARGRARRRSRATSPRSGGRPAIFAVGALVTGALLRSGVQARSPTARRSRWRPELSSTATRRRIVASAPRNSSAPISAPTRWPTGPGRARSAGSPSSRPRCRRAASPAGARGSGGTRRGRAPRAGRRRAARPGGSCPCGAPISATVRGSSSTPPSTCHHAAVIRPRPRAPGRPPSAGR